MADDDDLARLMREIEEFDRATGTTPQPTAQPPAKKEAPVEKRSSEVAEKGDGAVSRVRWALIAAVAAGVVGFVLGMLLGILPYVSPIDTAIGAALGGALIGLLGGPPKWLS